MFVTVVDVVASIFLGVKDLGWHIASLEVVFVPGASGAGFQVNSFLSISKTLGCKAP